MDNVLHKSLLIGHQQYYVNGDFAYVLRPWLKVPFKRKFPSSAEHIDNTTMSAVRVLVEKS